jgi:hypothetical protein
MSLRVVSTRDGQREGEGCTAIRLALERYFAAVHFDQALCDAEAKACAWYIAHTKVVGSEEFSKQSLLIFR